jgi:hypothetical protein
MTRTAIGTCVAVAFALVASLGAQTSPPSQTRSSAMSDKDNISVTGCLQKDASGGYILANAHIDTSAATSSSTATGSSSTSTATGTTGMTPTTPGATWKLEGNTADLDSHVGHKVTVTGKESAASGSSSSSTSPAATSATGTTGTATAEEQKSKSESASSKKLEVKSVKMLSSSCS